MSSLDGQAAWRDLWDRLDEKSRGSYFRMNVSLPSSGPAMDDVERMEELRRYVHTQPNNGSDRRRIIYALLSSTLYFELATQPVFYSGRYYCHGTIRCRLKGITARQVLNRFQGPDLAFTTEHEILGYYALRRDYCQKCSRYRKQVHFTVRHTSDLIHIYLQIENHGTCSLSGFPHTVQWFSDQQRLGTYFGAVDYRPANTCTACSSAVRDTTQHFSIKRKATLNPDRSQSLPRKRRRPGLRPLQKLH